MASDEYYTGLSNLFRGEDHLDYYNQIDHNQYGQSYGQYTQPQYYGYPQQGYAGPDYGYPYQQQAFGGTQQMHDWQQSSGYATAPDQYKVAATYQQQTCVDQPGSNPLCSTAQTGYYQQGTAMPYAGYEPPREQGPPTAQWDTRGTDKKKKKDKKHKRNKKDKKDKKKSGEKKHHFFSLGSLSEGTGTLEHVSGTVNNILSSALGH